MTPAHKSRRAFVAFIALGSICHTPIAMSQASQPTPAKVSIVEDRFGRERQLTSGPGGRILTNTGVWSPDGQWIVYDTRSDPAGNVFDGEHIEMVHLTSREVRRVYSSKNGAQCGVVTFHPTQPKVVCILGPENPTPGWSYGPSHRQGLIVDIQDFLRQPQADPASPWHFLDARNLTTPFTPGALRGGSHVHVWDAAGDWVSFTYEDHVLQRFTQPGPDHDQNQRNVGVCVPVRAVRVPKTHPRNHDGQFFSVLVTKTTSSPRPGSDEIEKAFEEGWVGVNGYLRPDGSRQRRALAFLGTVRDDRGETISELFIADLPEDMTVVGTGPLEGTDLRMPAPPQGVVQRRLTRTSDRKFPGTQGARHWARSSPDGSQIAFLMKDDAGIAQLWTVSPNGGPSKQVSFNPWPVASAFSWSLDGLRIAHILDQSVCLTEVATRRTFRITSRVEPERSPRPEACVISPQGTHIAFVRNVPSPGRPSNQICVVEVGADPWVKPQQKR